MTDPIITAPPSLLLAAVVLAESVTRDPVAAEGGSIGTALVVAAGWVIREWLKNRRHARNGADQRAKWAAEEAAAKRKAEAELIAADAREVPGLVDHIERMWAEREELRAEAEQLRARLAELADAGAEAAKRASGREDTQVTEMRRIASESRAEMPAYRDPDEIATAPETPAAKAVLGSVRHEVPPPPSRKDRRRE